VDLREHTDGPSAVTPRHRPGRARRWTVVPTVVAVGVGVDRLPHLAARVGGLPEPSRPVRPTTGPVGPGAGGGCADL